jgi:hypothetical protein
MEEMAMTHTLSQRAALTGAVDVLRDLRDESGCRLDASGTCQAHHWTKPEPCPQLRLRVLLNELDQRPTPPPYSRATLIAIVSGLHGEEEAHVRFAVNGHTHTGALHAEVSLQPGIAPTLYVDLSCGDRIPVTDPGDVLEIDVHAPARYHPGRDQFGIPTDPTPDPR